MSRRILQSFLWSGLAFISFTVEASIISGYAVGSYNSIINEKGKVISTSGGAETFAFDNSDNGGLAVMTWGTPQRKSNWMSNSFVFNGNASDTYTNGILGTASVDNLFSIGSFDYYNAETSKDNISAVNFRVDMSIDGFMQDTLGTLGDAYLEFTLSINNTPDNNDPLASADSVWVSAVNVGMTMPDGTPLLMAYDFTTGMDMYIGGDMYTFMLMGFSRDGGVSFESQAVSQENTLTTAEIFATMSPATVVPVPAAVWLMGSGLLGLFGFAFRNRRN